MPISTYLKNLRQKVGNEILQIPSVAAIIRGESERIILVKDTKSKKWGLPAGAIDPGETPEEAIIREVFEETGLKIEPTKIKGVFGGKEFRYVYQNGDRVEYFIVVFECRIIGEEKPKNRDGEVSKIKYFPPDKIPNLAIPYPESLFAKT